MRGRSRRALACIICLMPLLGCGGERSSAPEAKAADEGRVEGRKVETEEGKAAADEATAKEVEAEPGKAEPPRSGEAEASQSDGSQEPTPAGSELAALDTALAALPRDRVTTLTAAVEAFEAHIQPTSTDEVKGDAFARVYALREELEPKVIDEKYVDLESEYLGHLEGTDPDLPPLSKAEARVIEQLVAAGVVMAIGGEGMSFGELIHTIMLAETELLPVGAVELVKAHVFETTVYPGCFYEEEPGYACDVTPMIEHLVALDGVIPKVTSKALRDLLVAQHRVLWEHAREHAGGRPELKTLGAWKGSDR